jgi:hypothetical protein
MLLFLHLNAISLYILGIVVVYMVIIIMEGVITMVDGEVTITVTTRIMVLDGSRVIPMVSLLQISGGLILGHSSVNYVIALVT